MQRNSKRFRILKNVFLALFSNGFVLFDISSTNIDQELIVYFYIYR